MWMIGKISLSEKEGHQNMENITDVEYTHTKRVQIKIKNLGEYHNLCVRSDTLLLADVFKNFRNMCLKIYKLNAARFLTASRLVWQAALTKTKVKLDLLTDIDILLIVEVSEVQYVMLFIICER